MMARVKIEDIKRDERPLSEKYAERVTGGAFVIEERSSSFGVIRDATQKFTLFQSDGIPLQ